MDLLFLFSLFFFSFSALVVASSSSPSSSSTSAFTFPFAATSTSTLRSLPPSISMTSLMGLRSKIATTSRHRNMVFNSAFLFASTKSKIGGSLQRGKTAASFSFLGTSRPYNYDHRFPYLSRDISMMSAPTLVSSSSSSSSTSVSATSMAGSDSDLSSRKTTSTDLKDPYYITTPIYYVNDKPHIGHAYTSVSCDALARFKRLDGHPVYFLTGTDEHGQKIEKSAQGKNQDPQEFVNDISENFRSLNKQLQLSNDYFVRTTDENHKKDVQFLWKRLADNGYIYLATYEGWYSVRDECFYTESELVDGKAPTGAEVEWVAKEPSYFFKLSAFEDVLLEYYENHPDFIGPTSRRNEVISFVKGGLRDLSISRTTFKWGVPVPGDPDHVMYVWLDALANYISALDYSNSEDTAVNNNKENGSQNDKSDQEETENEKDDSLFQKFWPADLHMVGKDIIRFHAVYWPAFLMGANLPLPKRIFAHGWWTKDKQKISKSLGNVIDPLTLLEQYGLDSTRYFLLAEVPFGNDGDFSHDVFLKRTNTNLANDLGNLIQRTLTLAFKNCDKALPIPGYEMKKAIEGEGEEEEEKKKGEENEDKLTLIPKDLNWEPEDIELLTMAQQLLPKCRQEIDKKTALHKYAEHLTLTAVACNKYIDSQAPWALRKTDIPRMQTVLYVILETLRHLGILYQPMIPNSANKLLDAIGVPSTERNFACLHSNHNDDIDQNIIKYLTKTPNALKPGTPISKPTPIFPRHEAA